MQITVSIQYQQKQFLMTSFRLLREAPEVQNKLYSVFYTQDEHDNIYYAKIFSIAKLQQYGLDEALEYNEEVLSDTEGNPFPEYINQIIASIPNDGLFTFISQPYETNLESYMRMAHISQSQALKIFDNVLKATYSIYSSGYWHKCIRPEHFVKVGDIWKLDSLVYSEDVEKSQNLMSEYTWNRAYQPPEAYERKVQSFSDQEFLPIVVWNLGSLLLDLFFSVHKLNSYDILQCYKGKKFNLENIKVKKTDIFSRKLKDILACMLHYDPKQRMRLQEVFSNQYLSRQVALAFREKHKSSLKGAPMKIFTGGKSALSSALLNKEERQKGSKILPINELVKCAVNSTGPSCASHGFSNLNLNRNVKSLNEVQTDEDSGKASISTIFDRLLNKISPESNSTKNSAKQPSNIEQLLQNKDLSIPLKMYKTIFDKSELLTITGEKFTEVNYREHQKEISLISKYAVEVMSYLNLNELHNDMQRGNNSLDLDQIQFKNFQNSWEFEAFKRITSESLKQKDNKINNIKNEINKLKSSERKFVEQPEINAFINIDYKTADFLQIKASYRKILKISYDVVTREYNQNANNQKIARLAMYIVYCLTIDKLYHPTMIEKNFMPYFEWTHEKPSTYIPIEMLERYFEEASIKTLVYHAKEVLERFFKL